MDIMDFTEKDIVGEVVAKDYRTASVFKAHQIDFCCNGNRSISDVCANNTEEVETILNELSQSIQQTDRGDQNFQAWDMDLLADYIEKKHHRYVAKAIPELQGYLAKISEVHGENHPELLEIEALFTASANELKSHMDKEETILFPYVRSLAALEDNQRPAFGTIQNPIKVMMEEHDNEGERFRRIATLSDNYTPPTDACATYKTAFSLLEEFENDLHKHIHLENNILFPKTIEAESQLTYA